MISQGWLTKTTALNTPHCLVTVFERVDSPGELDSLVGTQTWLSHEERNVTIVRAIPSVD